MVRARGMTSARTSARIACVPEAEAGQLHSYIQLAEERVRVWDGLRELSDQHTRHHVSGLEAGTTARNIERAFDALRDYERFFAFPGTERLSELKDLWQRGEVSQLTSTVEGYLRLILLDAPVVSETPERPDDASIESDLHDVTQRPHFEILVVANDPDNGHNLRSSLKDHCRRSDPFTYDIVVVGSAEEALVACLANSSIQAVVVASPCRTAERGVIESISRITVLAQLDASHGALRRALAIELANRIRATRPEVDLYLLSDDVVGRAAALAGGPYQRVFYPQDSFVELHLSILDGVGRRFRVPFFEALRSYAERPMTVFHAMPISRSRSIHQSRWMEDYRSFYGGSVFLAETSATAGGLDSLSSPTGPIKEARERAAHAFGARKTFFVTNGTSTANKIVLQAVAGPGDIVLMSRDAHKSHHHGLVLVGAHPLYVQPFPLPKYGVYGGVTLAELKRRLCDLRSRGDLDRVKAVLLTNCTFDGVVYDPLQVMQELLAIKPDMIFIWDEAWFATARWSPMLRGRTAMEAASLLTAELASDTYRRDFVRWRRNFERLAEKSADAWLEQRLYPNPKTARVRVYATQSTHKTMTSLRQGAMVHVYDQDYDDVAFNEAFLTHTSTSPNYHILASLDVARRQADLEGFHLTRRSINIARSLRQGIDQHPLLSRFFAVLGPEDLIPQSISSSSFVVHPAHVTVAIKGGWTTGDQLRRRLAERHRIQVNKTSPNTLLFLVTIGSTGGSVGALIGALAQIAQEAAEIVGDQAFVGEPDLRLPGPVDFHESFRIGDTGAGNIRAAYFAGRAADERVTAMSFDEVATQLQQDRCLVSASFVTPYPPGTPVLVPGQQIDATALEALRRGGPEIHGLVREKLRVFADGALVRRATQLSEDARPWQA